MEFPIIVIAIFALGYREVWFQFKMSNVPDDKLFLLGVAFAFATAISGVWLLICSFLGESGVKANVVLEPSNFSNLLLLATFTAISWPAAFLAILTTLGSSRAGFVDWGMV